MMKMVALFAVVVSAQESGGILNFTWEDCGDSSTHGKIKGVDKSSITLGEDTTVTGSGTIDEAVTAGDFTITAKAGPITQNYDGKVCEAKEFDLPLGLGQVNWKGLSCPAAAGDIDVAVGVKLASAIPASMAKADISVAATGTSADDKLLCMSIHTQAAVETEAQVTGGTLNLTWEDCGDASTHGTIKGIDKSSITLGEDTTVTGSGTIDEDVTAGDFTITAKAGLITQKYSGDVCAAKEFDLPLGLGQVNWKGLSCPVAAGDIDVAIGIKLASAIPADLAKADVSVAATGSTAADKLVCLKIHTTGADAIAV